MRKLPPSVALLFFTAVHLPAWRSPPGKSLGHSQHKVQLLAVSEDVKLEVLDWGGEGRPIVFLAGAGFDAHAFDAFAPKLIASHRVYGITRRGFGASSAPVPTGDNYSAHQLGDDILAILDALHVQRPVLVGHSIAGEEMSSIATRYPSRVAGLVYLDAAYSYAYYSPQLGDWKIDAVDLNQRLNHLLTHGFQDRTEISDLQIASAQVARDLGLLEKQQSLMPPRPKRPANAPPPDSILLALNKGGQKFTNISVPILAIFADPHDFGDLYKDNPTARAAVIENDLETTSAQANALQAGVPTARIVKIPNADHFIFRSNEAEVLREMNAFLSGLH